MASNSINYKLYLSLLVSMHVNISKGIQNPAKPLFMLSIIESIETGTTINNRIFYEDIKIIFTKKCKEYQISKVPNYHYPFYYLTYDTFYHLRWISDEIKPLHVSPKFLREHVSYAYFDNALWNLLQDTVVRKEFKDAIEKQYLI